MKSFVNFLVVLALFQSCESESARPRLAEADYFPLQTGRWYVYDVHEVRYYAGVAPDVLDYELKMEVVDSFPSAEGGHTYVIHRSRRADETVAWEALDTWSARADDRRLIVAEGNTPFVKLAFPIVDGNRWDGNAMNGLGEDGYALKSVGASKDLNGLIFENTVTVEQEMNEDVIVFTDKREEVYARGVGLVRKEIIQLHYCTQDDCLGQQKVDHGMELEMVIKAYGTV